MSLANEMRAILTGHGESGNLDRYAQMRGAQHVQDSINKNYRILEEMRAKHREKELRLQAHLAAQAERRQRGGTGLGQLIGGVGGLLVGGPVGAFIGQGLGGIAEGAVMGNRAGQGRFNLASAPMTIQQKLGYQPPAQTQSQGPLTDEQMREYMQRWLKDTQRVYPQLAR